MYNKLDGIKDFIECNKSSLENMHKEMLASYGQVPLVWLTIDEAKLAVRGLTVGIFEMKDLDKEIRYKSLANDIEMRIEQLEGV